MSSLNLNRYTSDKNYLVTISSAITAISLLMLVFAVFGYRYNFLSVGYSLLFLTKYAIYISLFAFVLSLIALGYSLKLYKKFMYIIICIFVLSINLTIISFFYIKVNDLRSNPMINDVSTNYLDIIEFKVHTEHNLPKGEHSLIQKYGGFKLPNYNLSSLILSGKSKHVVFNKSLELIENMGLEITFKDLEEGIIEAVEKSFWYGFNDDIIIRIENLISGDIIIDVRSASRTGRSDFGANSKRIKSYLNMIQKEISFSYK